MASKKTGQTKRTTKAKGAATATDLVITRVFDAPRERVWNAWTDPDQAKRWWGPRSFTAPVIKIDLRVGGRYLFCMRGPDGKDYWSTGAYKEIVPMERLVLTDSFADEKGNVVPATHYGMPADIPLELLVTITFEDLDGKTKMTLRHSGFPAGVHRGMAEQGWSESLEKLADSVKRGSFPTETGVDREKRQLVLARVFNAPRERVFHAYTDPRLIPKWWGPRRYTTTVDRMEVRKGGKWRYVQHDKDGKEFAFRGEYLEIVPPERLVSTFEWEGMPGHIVRDTATFEERDGKTRLTITSQFESLEDLEGMLESGAESGGLETWDRLEELVARP